MTRVVGTSLFVVVLVGGLLSPWVPPAQAQRLDAVFEAGNQAYYRGDFAGAIARYRTLLEAGVDDPAVTYNLATAHARLGHYGQAIRFYERTLRIAPGDEAAEQGLDRARRALGERQAAKEGEALQHRRSFGEAMVRGVSEPSLAWLLVVSNLVLFGLLIAWRFVRAETGRLSLGIAIPIAAVLVVLSATGLAIERGVFREGEAAIVVREDASLREGPDAHATVRGEVSEGSPARILDRQGRWVRVKLPGDRQGWMDARDVGAI